MVGGVGERRLFRIGMKYLGENHPDIAKAVLELIPEYTRWDNIFCLMDTSLKQEVVALVRKQLDDDMQNMIENKPVSLLAKWMPSECSSSKEKHALAKTFIKELDITERQYRKMLSTLKRYLKVVETYIARNAWCEIDYAAVPSKANLRYNKAFLRHDEERRKAYLESLEKGETKINAGVLFPHDIVNKYTKCSSWGDVTVKDKDTTLEELWKALPDYVNSNGNTICVADGSGSMTNRIGGKSSVTALDVANALAIYFSERCSGEFKNKYITFSNKPKFVDFGSANSLREKIEIALRYGECENTNIEAVFDLILQTAINGKMAQEDIPKNVLIISDMEFDSCADTNAKGGLWYQPVRPTKRLFEVIADKYKEHGYQLPRLVFWNVNSRTGAIPVKENDLGVALVSGFSPAIAKMVLSNSTDPLECLLEQLNSERYEPVEQAVTDLVA